MKSRNSKIEQRHQQLHIVGDRDPTESAQHLLKQTEHARHHDNSLFVRGKRNSEFLKSII